MHYQAERPAELESNAEQIGSIYWVPRKGDIVVSWDERFLTDICEQGLTDRLIEWAHRLASRITREFGGRVQ